MRTIFDSYEHPIKLVLSDLDGCLTGGETAPIDCSRLKVIRDYNELSLVDTTVPPVSICSGRPHAYVEAFGRFIGAYMPSIFENGCGMHCRKWGMGREYHYHPAITRDPDFGEMYLEMVSYLRDKIVEPLDCGVIQGKRYCISITPRYDRTMEELIEHIDAIPEQVMRYFNVTRSIAVVDLTPRGIDKGEGLLWLIEILRNEFKIDITLTNVLAVGDSWGDLSMMEKAGITCAPANSALAAKEAANFVSEEEDAGGVAEAIAGAVAVNRRLGVTTR